MAIKPANGEVVRETRETQVIPAGESRKLSDGTPLPSKGDFWDWLESTPVEMLNRWEAEISIYRLQPNGRKDPLCEQLHYPPDNVRLTQRWIKERFGGGPYSVMCKLEKQLRFAVDFSIEGPAKTPDEVAESARKNNGAGSFAAGSDLGIIIGLFRDMQSQLIAELRAARGGDSAIQSMRDSMALGTEVLRTAVPAVAGIVSNAANHGNNSAADPMRDIQMRFMDAMIAKMMNPTDPIETFAKMLTAVKTLMPEAGAGGGESIAQTLIRVAPQAMGQLGTILQSAARMRELELQAFLASKGQAPMPPMRTLPAMPTPQAPPAAPAPAVVPEATTANGAPAQPTPSLIEFLEMGIVNMVNNQANTAKQAAHECLILIDAYFPDLVNQILAQPNPEDELLKFFREQPILQQVPQDPRLTEVVKHLVELARESRMPPDASIDSPPAAGPFAAPPAAENPQPSA